MAGWEGEEAGRRVRPGGKESQGHRGQEQMRCRGKGVKCVGGKERGAGGCSH